VTGSPTETPDWVNTSFAVSFSPDLQETKRDFEASVLPLGPLHGKPDRLSLVHEDLFDLGARLLQTHFQLQTLFPGHPRIGDRLFQLLEPMLRELQS
jgi:hypothetical protein